MLEKLGLPKHAKIYGTAAGLCFAAFYWALEPSGPVRGLAEIVTVMAPVAVALISIMFMIDWWFEREYRRIRRIGSALLELSSAMLRAQHDYVRSQKPRERAPSPVDANATFSQWDREQLARQEYEIWANERFYPDVAAQMVILHKIGIDAPWMVRTNSTRDFVMIARWLGAMGKLLTMDRLQEAKEYGPDQQYWWGRLG